MAKRAYIGIETELPVYSETVVTAAVTDANISDYFDVSNGSYYFALSGGTWTSNNGGKNSSTATTTLTAKLDISALSFDYSYSSEANYDKFTLKVAGTTVENAVSGTTTNKSWSGSLSKGQTIELTYTKDSSNHSNDDKCTMSNMSATATVRTQTGTEIKLVARKVKKMYLGIGELVETEISLSAANEIQDFWSCEFNADGVKPQWNSETSRFEFSGVQTDQAQNFYNDAMDGSLPVAANTLYGIAGDRTYYAKATYIDYTIDQRADVVQVYRGEVNGIARKIKKAYIGVNGVAQLCYSSGIPLSDFAVGSTVKLNVNGAAKEFIVVHQGKPSDLYDDSCNGTWLLMKDLYESRAWHSSNSNIYASSTVHSYLNSTFLGMFDPVVQSAIKQVKIPYVNGTGGAGAVASGANGLTAKIFLLSGYEVGYTKSTNSYFPIDGVCLSYFSGASNSTRIAYLNGSAKQWWTRSPCIDGSTEVWIVSTNGDNGYSTLLAEYGIRPALLLPKDTLVDEQFNVIG